MKYTDWVDSKNNDPHYAVGDEYDWFMANAYRECHTLHIPLPQELVDWWVDKYEQFKSERSDGIGWYAAGRIRKEYNLHGTKYASDWNGRDEWRLKEESKEKTIKTSVIEVEVIFTPTSGDAPTVVHQFEVPLELSPGHKPHISVRVTSKN